MFLFVLPYFLLQLGILADPSDINTDKLTTDERVSVMYDSLYLSIYISIYLLIPYSLVSIYCFVLARNTHSYKQYPPPGTEIPFKSKIIKEEKALHYAYGLYFCSVIMLLSGTVKLWVSIDTLNFIKGTLNAI